MSAGILRKVIQHCTASTDEVRCRIHARVAFAAIFVTMSLAGAVMAHAQTPAGPNRPAQVPEDYVVTPFGYFHPSCVVHLAKGEELLEGGAVIKKADGTMSSVPACEYPHYTARGEVIPAGSQIKPPDITHSWIVGADAITSSSYGKIVADWNVPSAPQSHDGQTIYFFPGLEDYNTNTSIIQPVLGWDADFTNAWGIASWNCCPRGTADESSPVRANTGDHIHGAVQSTCRPGTLSCSTWNITTQDVTTGGSTNLNNTPSEGQTFNWAFGGVLEAYDIARCSDYPPNNYLTFYPTLYDDNFNIIDYPGWSPENWTAGLTPQCDYGAQASTSEVTLLFGSFTLTVSTTGQGSVTSSDGSINCPGTCMHTYQVGTQVLLNPTPASGWAFIGWSGGGCSGTGQCIVSMIQNQRVSATFVPAYTLTVTTTGNGGVTSADGIVNCFGTCYYSYPENGQVTLIADPSVGYTLDAWGGACSGNNPTCTVTMTGNQMVSAAFTQAYYTLTASISGEGRVSSSDGFINCPGTCSHTYLSFTRVALNASSANGWSFAGWSGACTGTGLVCELEMLGNYGVSAYFFQPGHGLGFVPVAPCRLVDTRVTGNPIQGGTSQDFDIAQLSQTGNCGIPSGEAAYSLNVTVAPHGRLGYLTVWPAGLAQPITSTLNSDGRTKAVAAIVQAGTSDSISVYASQTTDLILDTNGYFSAPTGQTLQFYPLPPCRVIDTRNLMGPLGGPALVGRIERDFPVLDSSCIPQNAGIQAYSFNITVSPNPAGQAMSYLTVWPQGTTRPTVSTLNNYTGTRVANAAIVPAATDGQIAVYPSQSTDLIVDINGYFAPAGQGGLSLYPTAPCRVLDTRNGSGPFSGRLIVNVQTSPCMPSSAAQTYVFNATVLPTQQLGYLTLWPDGEQQPMVSTLNASDGAVTSNMAIVPTNNGKVDAYAPQPTQLIMDISSYFAP